MAATGGPNPGSSDPRRWRVGLGLLVLLVGLGLPLVASPLGATGSGKLTISPTATTAGSTGNVLTLTYTTPTSSGLSGRVAVVIPSGWTRPQSSSSAQPGFLKTQRNTCSSATLATITDTGGNGVGPWTAVAKVTCAKGKTFNFRYAGGGSAVTAPKLVGTYQFTASVGVGIAALSPLAVHPVEAVRPGPTAQLTFTTAPQSLARGATSGPMTVRSEDRFSNAVAPPSAITVNLSSTSAGASFRNLADSDDITTVVIAARTTAASFRYRDTVEGAPTITAADAGRALKGASQVEQVDASPAGPTESHSGLSMPVTDPGLLTGDFFAGGVVYLADYDHRTGGLGRMLGFDEASRTTQVLADSVGRPTDAVVDGAGNLYFTEHIGGTIYRLTNGVVTRFVAGFSRPQNLAIDAAGTTLYVSDATSDDVNNKIYAVDLATRAVTTLAGNGFRSGAKVCDDVPRPAKSVSVNKPIGIAVDGNWLYISSQFDDLVYRVDLTSGLLSRYAGSCTTTQVGDHGAATAAYVQKPQGLDVDGVGNLYVLQYNGAVRRIDAISRQITTVYALRTKAGSNSDLSFDATDGSFWLSAQAVTTSVLVKIVKV